MGNALRRSLWPREHGAYGQLGAPLLGALLLRAPTVASISLAAAACLAFLANEPLLVLLGQRGNRMRTSHRALALRRLALAVIGAAIFAVLGLARSSSATLEVAAIAAVPAIGLAVLAGSRRQHTLGGELIAACTLPGAAAPVAVSAGAAVSLVIAIWAAWTLGYLCSVVAVHRVLTRHRQSAAAIDRMLAVGFAAITVVAVALHAAIPPAIIATPLAGVALYLVVRPPAAKRMRAIGVVLVIASVASVAILLAVAG